jgi:hypothetical protein
VGNRWYSARREVRVHHYWVGEGYSLPCSPASKLLRAHQLHSGLSRGHALPLRHCTHKPTPQPDESLPSNPHPHPAQVVVTPIGRPVTEARVLRVARDITLASLNDIASASIGRAVSAVLERDSALLPLTTDVGTCDSQPWRSLRRGWVLLGTLIFHPFTMHTHTHAPCYLSCSLGLPGRHRPTYCSQLAERQCPGVCPRHFCPLLPCIHPVCRWTSRRASQPCPTAPTFGSGLQTCTVQHPHWRPSMPSTHPCNRTAHHPNRPLRPHAPHPTQASTPCTLCLLAC